MITFPNWNWIVQLTDRLNYRDDIGIRTYLIKIVHTSVFFRPKHNPIVIIRLDVTRNLELAKMVVSTDKTPTYTVGRVGVEPIRGITIEDF